ncbi:MAG: NAD(P)/FAD-dependent oxidoreductase [Clostridia bacterium]|nr:NAD(P)/FAD-dependent oxidoreductase [Clostridia bacterium]
MYDVVIIGAGPAGISASLYAKRANLNVLVIYNGKSNLEMTEKIDNYYGFKDGIDGKELYINGIEQAKNLGVEIKKDEVFGIQNLGNTFEIRTEKEKIETKTLIIATGNKNIRPNIKGIAEFEGKGISYCAICDGFFFKNKDIAVIGNGKYALNEAKELSHIVKNITILTNGLKAPLTEFKTNDKKIKEIKGEQTVREIEFEDGEKIEVDGIFVAIGQAGAGNFAKTLGIMQSGDYINVNDKMETNIKGIYACGNATGGLLQICKAVFEGAMAGLSAVDYIRNFDKEN